MKIYINDKVCEYPEKINIATLVAQEGIQTEHIAVALDEVMIPRSRWDSTGLTDGSRVLIIKAVQGG